MVDDKSGDSEGNEREAGMGTRDQMISDRITEQEVRGQRREHRGATGSAVCRRGVPLRNDGGYREGACPLPRNF